MILSLVVSTVCGDSREVTRTWPDGSLECPYCAYPITLQQGYTGHNPWCDAYPAWTVEALSRHRKERATTLAREAQERANRESTVRYAQSRHDAHQAWEQEQITQARTKGCCVRCLFLPGWERVKFIKHRGECPKLR